MNLVRVSSYNFLKYKLQGMISVFAHYIQQRLLKNEFHRGTICMSDGHNFDRLQIGK